MAVNKCLECKYFEEGKTGLGRCKLHTRKVFPDDTCREYTNKVEVKQETSKSVILLDNRVDALEAKIEKLEKIIFKLL